MVDKGLEKVQNEYMARKKKKQAVFDAIKRENISLLKENKKLKSDISKIKRILQLE